MARYEMYFRKTIMECYPHTSDVILARTQRNFESISRDTVFSHKSTNPIDKRLDFSAFFLALVKALDEQKETYENIRGTCLKIVLEYVRPKNKLQLALKRLPSKFINTWLAAIFLRVLDRKFSVKAHDDGFRANIITDRNETFGFGFGFDIIECGICKLFKKHHYEKYAPILCEVDEITSALAGLQLVRTGTIAMGAKKCDFRFKKETVASASEG